MTDHDPCVCPVCREAKTRNNPEKVIEELRADLSAAHDLIGDQTVENDELRAEVDRLKAQNKIIDKSHEWFSGRIVELEAEVARLRGINYTKMQEALHSVRVSDAAMRRWEERLERAEDKK